MVRGFDGASQRSPILPPAAPMLIGLAETVHGYGYDRGSKPPIHADFTS